MCFFHMGSFCRIWPHTALSCPLISAHNFVPLVYTLSFLFYPCFIQRMQTPPPICSYKSLYLVILFHSGTSDLLLRFVIIHFDILVASPEI